MRLGRVTTVAVTIFSISANAASVFYVLVGLLAFDNGIAGPLLSNESPAPFITIYDLWTCLVASYFVATALLIAAGFFFAWRLRHWAVAHLMVGILFLLCLRHATCKLELLAQERHERLVSLISMPKEDISKTQRLMALLVANGFEGVTSWVNNQGSAELHIIPTLGHSKADALKLIGN